MIHVLAAALFADLALIEGVKRIVAGRTLPLSVTVLHAGGPPAPAVLVFGDGSRATLRFAGMRGENGVFRARIGHRYRRAGRYVLGVHSHTGSTLARANVNVTAPPLSVAQRARQRARAGADEAAAHAPLIVTPPAPAGDPGRAGILVMPDGGLPAAAPAPPAGATAPAGPAGALPASPGFATPVPLRTVSPGPPPVVRLAAPTVPAPTPTAVNGAITGER